ncbi:M20 family metallopeptidase [Candidatus Palauibacter sp.]|uniref:M20 family metallopeptidase n=1 Tax=Candidatus Palauibacter sp. TaxID=3101350 RepID=UPI003B02699F
MKISDDQAVPELTGEGLEACVRFLQRLIRTRSMPGEEGELAMLVAAEMRALGYDEVDCDAAGNVIGLLRGLDEAPSVMFNTHLDHVDAGDPADWPHDPYGGEIHDGLLWGRGAIDIKGPLAAQVHGVARLIAAGQRPPGDVYVTSTVQEEVGGLGARYMAGTLRPDLVLIGEPSRNEVRRGHRGRIELRVQVRGKMAHASMTDIGRNPLTVLGRFLAALEDVDLAHDPDLGTCSIAPTLIGTDQTSGNVIPGLAEVTLDCRTVSGQDAASLREQLLPVLRACEIEGSGSDILIPQHERSSYSGYEMTYPADNPALSLPADHDAVRTAAEVLAGPLGAEPPVDIWDFATDGGHFGLAGMTVVGFGPGDDRLAHTVHEHIVIDELATGIRGNAALAFHWPARYARAS